MTTTKGAKRRQALLVFMLACAGAATPAMAEDLLAGKTVKIVVGSQAGSAPDLISRVLAEEMAASLKSNVIVENRPGAAGTLASTVVSNAPPDGLTLMMGTVSSLALAPLFYPVTYDPRTSFTPIGMAANVPLVLVTAPASNTPTYAAFAEKVRTGPELAYSSPGIGGPQHLAGVLLSKKLDRPMLHVPYKSGGAATTAVAAGEVAFAFAGIPAAVSMAAAGKVLPILVTATKRSPAMPDTQSASEVGMPDFLIDNWHALVGPAGIAPNVQAALEAALAKALTSDKVKQQFLKLGAEPADGRSKALAATINSESTRWASFVKENKLKE